MNNHKREIKSFFYSQYFSDGLRMTIGIISSRPGANEVWRF
jgi:hypothetical protein